MKHLLRSLICYGLCLPAAYAQEGPYDVRITPQTIFTIHQAYTPPAALDDESLIVITLDPNTPPATTAITPVTPAALPGFVEVGGNYASLSNNEGNWAGEYVMGEFQSDEDNRWHLLATHAQEFHEDGNYFSVQNTHTFDADWYSDVAVGYSPSGFFLPQYRLDAFINRKWLDQRNFVTTAGFGLAKAHDSEHSDRDLFFGTSYYFEDGPWVIQDGIRLNRSLPGNAFSASYFVAVTEGRNEEHFITLRYGFGREAYQILGPTNVLNAFGSQDVSLTWKQWIEETTHDQKGWGFDATVEYYDNPYYNRTGFSLGFFREF